MPVHFTASMGSPAQPVAGPVTHDSIPEIGQLFTHVRDVLGLPRDIVAYRLGIGEDALAALEAGRLDLAPRWPELAPIVPGYVGLIGLDPGPVMALLGARFRMAGQPVQQQSVTTPAAHRDRSTPAARPVRSTAKAAARHYVRQRGIARGIRLGLAAISVLTGLAVLLPWPKLLGVLLP